jgi:hypothetical protein
MVEGVSVTTTELGKQVTDIRIPDGEKPSPEAIAARIDLGCACYHEANCPFMLFMVDDDLFDETPACECGGEEMAKAYAELTDLSAMLRLAGWEPRGAVGTRTTWIEP